MSAVNVIRRKRHGREDGLVVLTDGAWYNSDGVVQAIASKTLVLPHIPAVVAARGPSHLLPFLFEIACPCRDFEDLLGSIQSNAYDSSSGEYEIIIAGYSQERDRFEVYILPVHDRYACEGFPACLLMPVPGHLIQPALDPAIIKQIGWHIPDVDRLDAERDGLRLMECQRADGTPPEHVVGGFVQKTVIERQGISSSIIHTWPDQVGRKINPRPEVCCA